MEDEERKRRSVVIKWLQVNRKRAAKKINKNRYTCRRARCKTYRMLRKRWCSFFMGVVYLIFVGGLIWMVECAGCRE